MRREAFRYEGVCIFLLLDSRVCETSEMVNNTVVSVTSVLYTAVVHSTSETGFLARQVSEGKTLFIGVKECVKKSNKCSVGKVLTGAC